MRMFFILAIGLFLNSAGADTKPQQLMVEADLLINGKSISRPRVITLTGEPSYIEVGGRNFKVMKMGVLAQPGDKIDDLVLDLDFELHAQGRVIRTSPQIYAKAGVPAFMTLEESTPEEKIQLKVLARPVIR